MERLLAINLLAVSLITGQPTSSPTPVLGDKPSALAIFDATLAQFEKTRVALRKWQYHQTLTTQQFDSTGKVVAKGTWRSIVRPGDPEPLEYTGQSVEGKISFFKAGTEGQVHARTSETPEARTKPKPEKNQAESAVEAVHKYDLRDRYLWKRLPDENINGETTYVLAFQPKPGQRTGSREERFFGLLTGRLWISPDDFALLKAQAGLQAPCRLFWIIARVTTFQLNYELGPAQWGNRLLRLSKANATTVVTFPFYAVRQKHWQTVDKYEPRAPRGQASSQ